MLTMSFVDGRPKLKISLDKNMDKWALKEFLSYDPKDMFSNNILDLNPKLEDARSLYESDREHYFSDYVEGTYVDLKSILDEKVLETQKAWDSIQENFLSSCSALFSEHPWPKGAYIGFLSIFNCNPRFLEQKTFQCYYKHPEGCLYVCAHEMMHFMFYDYIDKHPELLLGASESKIWHLSEIFNIVILKSPQFVDLTRNPEPKPYPEHLHLIPGFEKIWSSSKNINSFIRSSVSIL